MKVTNGLDQKSGYLTLAVMCSWLLVAGPAHSQQSDDEESTQATSNQTTELGVSVTEIYDDNIFATRNDRESDFITLVSPFLKAETQGESGSFRLDLGASVAWYEENETEDYQDYWGGFELRSKAGSAVELFGGGRISRLHEDRSSPEDVLGPEPTEYDDGEAFLGLQFGAGRTTTRLGATYERLDFHDDAAPFTPANHDDRDRDLWSVGARASYALSQDRRIFVQGASDNRRYDEFLDDNGQHRDSDGYNAAVGLEFRSGLALSGEILAGYMDQEYDDPALKDVQTWDLGAQVRWRASPSTVVIGSLDRTLEETTLLDASSYLYTSLGGRVSHRARRDVVLGADLAVSRRDYQGLNRYDDIIETGLGASWFFHPNVFLGLDYRFTDQNSNRAENDYDENRVFLRLGARTEPAFDQTAPQTEPDPAESAGPEGVYVGVQGIHSDVVTELAGPRGADGTLETDVGDQGFAGGLFAGYGRRFDPWYLGAELSAEMAGMEYGHANAPDGRIFSVERGPSYALEGQLGAALHSGAVVYGLAGVVMSEFRTDYSREEEVAVIVRDQSWRTGLRAGMGLEFPVSGNLFGRASYAYTSYGDYDIDVGGDIDNFANEEGAFRLGVGYRFGEPAKPAENAVAHDFTGPYGGLQLGFGGLYTDNTGAREAGGDGGPDKFLTVERADHGGIAGAFGGAGVALGPVYLGGELEAEFSDLNWNSDREPVGRTYSVERDASYAAALRLGVLINESTLVYGRAGGVRSRFTTDYKRGSNHVVQEDWLNGQRYGGGVELATSERGFLRLDYSYTEYDDYSVDYVTGVDSFDNSEAVVRFGVGLRY